MCWAPRQTANFGTEQVSTGTITTMKNMAMVALILPAVLTLTTASVVLLWSVLGNAPWESEGSSSVGGAVDCGSGNADLSALRGIMPTTSDLGGEYSPETITDAEFADLGDDTFKATVDESSYIGGYSDIVTKGDFLSGGEGSAFFTHVVAFTDPSSARALFAHPFVGDASSNHVNSSQFGDDTAALHYIVSSPPPILDGYVIEFRVGALIIDAASIGSGLTSSFDETERAASLLCERLRRVAP